MKILEKLKEKLNNFWNSLGEDIKTINYPPDVKAELEASENGRLADLEQAQEQLRESKLTRRSKLADELSVHEDGTIQGLISKGQEEGTTTHTRTSKAKQPRVAEDGKGKERVD